ncbi:MAG: hypothetical protein AAFX99_30870, partial [Myxococcota bacterium]
MKAHPPNSPVVLLALLAALCLTFVSCSNLDDVSSVEFIGSSGTTQGTTTDQTTSSDTTTSNPTSCTPEAEICDTARQQNHSIR